MYDIHIILSDSCALTMRNFLHTIQFVMYTTCNTNYTIPTTMDMSVKKVIL